MAYYASKGYSRRTAARKKSIRETGHYGGTTKAARSGVGVPRTGGYSLYAAEGRGLSDVGYAKWVTARAKEGKGTVIDMPASYLLGMAQLGTPVGWAGKPGYKGSGLEARVKQEAIMSRGMMGEQTVAYGGAPPRGIAHALMGGMGRGEWERPQIKKEEAKTAGAGLGTVVAVGGIGYLLWALLR